MEEMLGEMKLSSLPNVTPTSDTQIITSQDGGGVFSVSDLRDGGFLTPAPEEEHIFNGYWLETGVTQPANSFLVGMTSTNYALTYDPVKNSVQAIAMRQNETFKIPGQVYVIVFAGARIKHLYTVQKTITIVANNVGLPFGQSDNLFIYYDPVSKKFGMVHAGSNETLTLKAGWEILYDRWTVDGVGL